MFARGVVKVLKLDELELAAAAAGPGKFELLLEAAATGLTVTFDIGLALGELELSAALLGDIWPCSDISLNRALYFSIDSSFPV